MAKEYLEAPVQTTGLPKGVPYIVGNEAAERFSYYGMNAILTVFMTQYLLNSSGQLAVMTPTEAKQNFHLFTSAAYFFPIVGAFIADGFLGKYKTILILSVVYCLGHLALAIDETRLGLVIGLGLLAMGAGGIKSCVSAHVGDQFGASNKHLLAKVFGWFYFSINAGSFISSLLTPWLLSKKEFGPHWAFGVPGLLMVIATIVFWMGRNKFIHIPPGKNAFFRDLKTWDTWKYIVKLVPIYLLVSVFWALYEQIFSAWVLQATKMDLYWMGRTWLPAQVSAINPLLILVYIPIFSYFIYPAFSKMFTLTPLRKIGIGFATTFLSFLISAWIEVMISRGQVPTIGWQIFAYMVLTAAEVMVSITCLEFSYTQAPKRLKSIIMGIFWLSVSLGNLMAGGFNHFIKNKDGSSNLSDVNYYLVFAGAMAVTTLIFVFVAKSYKEETIIQDEIPTPIPNAPA
ncbi:MAG: proton-dependent oligopeptide transporter family [Verrucomicrobiales bacterium]|nr:proton-dependent oligopeptide transporter family [Verrucomicrobiales bacterium]